MDKKIRVDKRKNIGKVAVVLAENPNKTGREVAKEAGIPHRTAARAINEVAQSGTKDPTIAYVVGSSKNRLQRMQGIFDRWIDQIEEKEQIQTKDLVVVKDLAKDDMSRITVLGGSITDEFGGLKDLTNLSLTELEAQRRALLG